MSTFVPAPAPANPSLIPADVRIPSLASGTCGRTHSVILPATPFIIKSPLDSSIRPAHRPASILSCCLVVAQSLSRLRQSWRSEGRESAAQGHGPHILSSLDTAAQLRAVPPTRAEVGPP